MHLFERECSIQRRHQKVHGGDALARSSRPSCAQRMGELAVALARTAGYRNAGTFEFLVDQDATPTSWR